MTTAGFEPTTSMRNCLVGSRDNHSAKSPFYVYNNSLKNNYFIHVHNYPNCIERIQAVLTCLNN